MGALKNEFALMLIGSRTKCSELQQVVLPKTKTTPQAQSRSTFSFSTFPFLLDNYIKYLCFIGHLIRGIRLAAETSNRNTYLR